MEQERANEVRLRGIEPPNLVIDDPRPNDHVTDAILYGTSVVNANNLFGVEELSQQVNAIYQARPPLTEEAIQRVIDDITGQVPATQAPQIVAAQPIPTTREYLFDFYVGFHEEHPTDEFLDSLPLDDKLAAKQMIINYNPPIIEDEESLIDLPESQSDSPVVQSLMNDIYSHERAIDGLRESLRLELESAPLPQISVDKIKADFEDFWDVRITGNLELELTSKFDVKLSHSFKERPLDAEERTILVNLGKYRFKFKLSDMSFLRCEPLNFRVDSSLINNKPHPHVSNYICWGSQDEIAKDAIIRKDFKLFSRLLFQAITNYNNASTFCGLLRYKIQLGDLEGERLIFRATTSHRTINLRELPKGINLSTISSANENSAYVLRYQRYIPYLNHYLTGYYFKVSKHVNELGFIKQEVDPVTNRPLYTTVDDADIARILAKRGPSDELGF